MTVLDFGCECCGKLDPLLETGDGRALCLACVEASPHSAGVDGETIVVLKLLTKLTAHRDGTN